MELRDRLAKYLGLADDLPKLKRGPPQKLKPEGPVAKKMNQNLYPQDEQDRDLRTHFRLKRHHLGLMLDFRDGKIPDQIRQERNWTKEKFDAHLREIQEVYVTNAQRYLNNEKSRRFYERVREEKITWSMVATALEQRPPGFEEASRRELAEQLVSQARTKEWDKAHESLKLNRQEFGSLVDAIREALTWQRRDKKRPKEEGPSPSR